MVDSRKKEKVLCIICMLLAAAVTVPLLVLGYYNYPSADDWSLGTLTYHAVRDGRGLGAVLREAVNTVLIWREKGEPRYANAFLGALQPGIWGEHFYRITPWIMIGSLFISELLLGAYLLRDQGRRNKRLLLPIVIPTLLLQILCVPYPVETFYWYVGAVNYTFIFSLSVILVILFLRLKEGGMTWLKLVMLEAVGSIIALFVGGDSYCASLSTVCLFGALSFLMLIKREGKALLRTLPLTLIVTAGLIVCLAAPGNMVRLDKEFGGTTTGAVHSILMSLGRTAVNIYSWTSLKILLMLLMMSPFLWKALKNVRYTFRYPAVFTMFSFGIYASQIVATMYVDGTTGGCRIADVLYYAYHVWLVLNAAYWLGWLQRSAHVAEWKGIGHLYVWLKRHTVVWFFGVGLALVVVLGFTELRTLSTYRACAWLLKGDARDYAAAWEERLNILRDDSTDVIYFDPLPGYQEMIFYADFQPGENWVNSACAAYYGKEYVGLKQP